MTKTVVILVGPKGSSKTHIGTVLKAKAGVSFLRVELIWLGLAEGQDGWAMVEQAIDEALEKNPLVVMESLGGSEGFERLRGSLTQKYKLRYVRIVVPLDVCLERVRNRDPRNHIAISDENVLAYNQLAEKVMLPWDLEITNEPPLNDDLILDAMKHIQQHDNNKFDIK